MANMNFGVNILPKQDDTYKLGNSTNKWQIFASSINNIAVGSTALATTAQNITEAINELKSDVNGLSSSIGSINSPASVFFDFQFTISTWTALSGGGYQATISNPRITSTSGIWVFYDDSYTTYAQASINATTDTSGSNHNAVFTTATQPTGTITGWIRVVDSINGIVPIERGGTGAGTLANAKSVLGVTTLEDNAKIQNISSSASILSLCNSLSSMSVRHYYAATKDLITDYPAVLSDIGANYCPFIQIETRGNGSAARIIITAGDTNDIPSTAIGYKYGSSLKWELLNEIIFDTKYRACEVTAAQTWQAFPLTNYAKTGYTIKGAMLEQCYSGAYTYSAAYVGITGGVPSVLIHGNGTAGTAEMYVTLIYKKN